jgi:aspartyl-tRNA synthetase
LVQNKGFAIFDQAELVVGIVAENCSEFTRKQLDELTEFVKKPQVGATGLVYVKVNTDGTYKSSVDKFYNQEQLAEWATQTGAKAGDLILVLAGKADKTRKAMNELRLEMGNRLGLREKNTFQPLWVVDFPMFEYDEDLNRYFAMHHPFTSPRLDELEKLSTDPASVNANAYDLVINGTEIGGGSIRIFNKELQSQIFDILGFTKEEAEKQFGFLMNAFEFGAPPHGGIAFGFDRLTAMMAGYESIREVIAFPKNNAGRDTMIDSPSPISDEQRKELYL